MALAGALVADDDRRIGQALVALARETRDAAGAGWPEAQLADILGALGRRFAQGQEGGPQAIGELESLIRRVRRTGVPVALFGSWGFLAAAVVVVIICAAVGGPVAGGVALAAMLAAVNDAFDDRKDAGRDNTNRYTGDIKQSRAGRGEDRAKAKIPENPNKLHPHTGAPRGTPGSGPPHVISCDAKCPANAGKEGAKCGAYSDGCTPPWELPPPEKNDKGYPCPCEFPLTCHQGRCIVGQPSRGGGGGDCQEASSCLDAKGTAGIRSCTPGCQDCPGGGSCTMYACRWGPNWEWCNKAQIETDKSIINWKHACTGAC